MARAFLAGAAILAGATSPSASPRDSGEEVAFAAPRIRSLENSGVALPQPLPPSDAARIRRIFALQARGDIPAAVAETAQLTDPVLLGHILADRYLSRPGLADAEEVAAWLASYAGLPDAPAIRTLLLTTRPSGAAAPPPGERTRRDEPAPATRTIARNPVLDRSVHEPAHAGSTDQALRLIARTRGLDAVYGALLRAEVAQALFTQGRDAEALRIAEAAHRQAKGAVGLAPYVAGLAAWRLDRKEAAGRLFEAVQRAEVAPAELRAAGAFWAARVRLRGPDPADATPWLQRAATYSTTFYGLLASQALGDSRAVLRGTLAQADVDAIFATQQGMRALALVQVGQPARAEAELRLLWPSVQEQPGLRRAVLMVAHAAGLDAFIEQVAPLAKPVGPPAEADKLPSSRLRPAGGFRVDPAMLYAMARVESNFDSKAVSPAGARGLMQIMPVTADYMVKKAAAPEHLARQLDDPASNLDLGQRYMLYLAEHDAVGGDLIRLLAGYNAGPGNLRVWEDAMRHGDDPLLFIEAIPNDETRAYVPRVLAYTWLYAAQLRLPTPSLDQLAAGNWPRFTPGRAAPGRSH